MQPDPLWPLIVYFIAVLGLVGAMVGLSYVLGQRHEERGTGKPFESGAESVGYGRLRFPAHFYLVAVFFVIFDLEAVFIFAWAVTLYESGWAGYIEILVFIGILVAALVYLWRIGALDWAPERRARAELPLSLQTRMIASEDTPREPST